MRRPIYKLTKTIKPVLFNSRGESIMEGLVSIMVFSVMMISVTIMIATSLRITEHSTSYANGRQSAVNNVIFERYGDGLTEILTLRDASNGIDVTITVKLPDSGEIVAFTPEAVMSP